MNCSITYDTSMPIQIMGIWKGIVKLFGNACGAVDVSDSVAEYSG